MTTLQVNDKEAEAIIAQYGREKIIEYIKTFQPKMRPKANDIDSKLKALKTVNPEGGERLKKAFSSLNQKLSSINNIDIEQEKQAYFDKKFSL